MFFQNQPIAFTLVSRISVPAAACCECRRQETYTFRTEGMPGHQNQCSLGHERSVLKQCRGLQKAASARCSVAPLALKFKSKDEIPTELQPPYGDRDDGWVLGLRGAVEKAPLARGARNGGALPRRRYAEVPRRDPGRGRDRHFGALPASAVSLLPTFRFGFEIFQTQPRSAVHPSWSAKPWLSQSGSRPRSRSIWRSFSTGWLSVVR